jgi:hypothetical protein
MPSSPVPPVQLSLSAAAARNLANATVTVPQKGRITPRWLLRILPYVHVDGGVYRVNRVAREADGQESGVDVLTVNSGEVKLPHTYVDYEVDPREYHLSTIQTVLHTHGVTGSSPVASTISNLPARIGESIGEG